MSVSRAVCPFDEDHTAAVQPDYCVGKHLSSEELIDMEYEYGAHNYHPIPVVFDKAEGVFVWDPEGKKYYDFLSAYSAVNQGHCHPKIVKTMIQQAQKLTLSSRAFYNAVFPKFAKFITEYFGYEMVLPMNSGAEAVETALKMCRKWGYDKKGIPHDEAIIITAKECFHGRTLGIISMSTDPDCKHPSFGPFIPGMVSIEYNNVDELKAAFKKYGNRVAGFLVEPIQGEAGVVVPDDGYLKQCYDVCKENNALFIADEIQSGIARTGKLIACDWENVHPDILILGKALSGGMMPVSCVLSNKEIMLCIKPGQHGSTFGGNPLAAAVAIASMEVVKEEKLAENALVLGEKFRKAIRDANFPSVKIVRGKGLLNAIVVDQVNYPISAWQICLLLKERGLLAKPTHDNIIRLAPPLVITEAQMDECIEIVKSTFTDIYKMKIEDLPKEYVPHASKGKTTHH